MNRHDLILIGSANELKVVNRALKIPFGAYEHHLGMQVFGLAEARDCVASFNEQAAVPNFRGLPVYIGHPDVKSFQGKYRDHGAYGWIVAMAANEADGRLDLSVDWTDPGETLVANEAFAYFSPLFLSVKRGGNIHPFAVKSIGLTQEPNIQYLAVACEELNESPLTQENNMTLLERIKALINKDSVQTEDEVVGFVQKMIEALQKLRESIKDKWTAEDMAYDVAENERMVDEALVIFRALETDMATANEAVPETVQATLDQTVAELETANETLSVLRGAHAGLLLDTALADGRITPATRAKWEERFGEEGADFEAVANELGAIDPAMKVKSVTKNGKPGDGAGATHADVVAAANELSGANGVSFEAAYAAVKKQDQFAHLFATEQAQ